MLQWLLCHHVAHSSSGPGHLPLKEEIRGSNPLCATRNYFMTGSQASLSFSMYSWKDPNRQRLPGHLQELLGASIADVALPTTILRKISQNHLLDSPFLSRLSEVINNYEYAGISPKHPQRLELYKRLVIYGLQQWCLRHHCCKPYISYISSHTGGA